MTDEKDWDTPASIGVADPPTREHPVWSLDSDDADAVAGPTVTATGERSVLIRTPGQTLRWYLRTPLVRLLIVLAVLALALVGYLQVSAHLDQARAAEAAQQAEHAEVLATTQEDLRAAIDRARAIVADSAGQVADDQVRTDLAQDAIAAETVLDVPAAAEDLDDLQARLDVLVADTDALATAHQTWLAEDLTAAVAAAQALLEGSVGKVDDTVRGDLQTAITAASESAASGATADVLREHRTAVDTAAATVSEAQAVWQAAEDERVRLEQEAAAAAAAEAEAAAAEAAAAEAARQAAQQASTPTPAPSRTSAPAPAPTNNPQPTTAPAPAPAPAPRVSTMSVSATCEGPATVTFWARGSGSVSLSGSVSASGSGSASGSVSTNGGTVSVTASGGGPLTAGRSWEGNCR